MIITGSRQRLFCGAWLLAAVLLGGLNVFPLISMEAQPAEGFSPTIRQLQADLQKFDAILDTPGGPLNARWRLPEFFNQSPVAANRAAGLQALPAQGESRSQDSEPVALPSLSGIIRTLDPNGSADFQAVLNGRSYREKDRLDDFTVDRITPAGVVLRRSENMWFIKCPTPYYSSDQGE